MGIPIFRAGIWKPRTRPNSFEGIGKKGLKWLCGLKEETGMMVSTEVANKQHVDEALDHDVDMVWIGARTTASPFAVQDIADALDGVDIPVLIKNPVNPDLELWIGAIERIYQAGIRRIGVIFRGFSVFTESQYRNFPIWLIPIDLKRQFPQLPFICDPSHMGGRKDLLLPLSLNALDLNYDGLMIESHMSPQTALSDAAQQVTPDELGRLLEKVGFRSDMCHETTFQTNLVA
jgi:chorismate mutase